MLLTSLDHALIKSVKKENRAINTVSLCLALLLCVAHSSIWQPVIVILMYFVNIWQEDRANLNIMSQGKLRSIRHIWLLKNIPRVAMVICLWSYAKYTVLVFLLFISQLAGRDHTQLVIICEARSWWMGYFWRLWWHNEYLQEGGSIDCQPTIYFDTLEHYLTGVLETPLHCEWQATKHIDRLLVTDR